MESGCTRAGCSNVASSICTNTLIKKSPKNSQSCLVHGFFQHSRFFCATTICISICLMKTDNPNPNFSQHCMAFGVIVPSPSQWWLYAWPLSEITAVIRRLFEERIHEDMTGRTTVIICTRWKPSTGEDSFSLFRGPKNEGPTYRGAFQETTLRKWMKVGWEESKIRGRKLENLAFRFFQYISSSNSHTWFVHLHQVQNPINLQHWKFRITVTSFCNIGSFA